MRKFKKGDVVRCTGKNVYGDYGAIGFEGPITKFWEDGTISVDKNWIMAPEDLELVNEVKPTRKEREAELKELEAKQTPEFEIGDIMHIKVTCIDGSE